VRRDRILAALQWLKVHNPYYADIQIDLAAVAALPADGPLNIPQVDGGDQLDAMLGVAPGPAGNVDAPEGIDPNAVPVRPVLLVAPAHPGADAMEARVAEQILRHSVRAQLHSTCRSPDRRFWKWCAVDCCQ